MNQKVSFLQNKTADGMYRLLAPGFAAAILSWADSRGPLENWTAFAYIAIDAGGKGMFRFQGGRAVPPEASHIHVKAVSDDFLHWEETLVPVEEPYRTAPMEDGVRLCAVSDLHLTARPWPLKKAILGAHGAEALLLAGDLTNDGTAPQYQLLKECLQKEVHSIKMFPVIGNHDVPVVSDRQGHSSYAEFQEWLFAQMEQAADSSFYGYQKENLEKGPDGAYVYRLGSIEVIGLQAVSHRRTFLFEDGRQLTWLDAHLSQVQGIKRHLIVCHAPLLHHNHQRTAGKQNPYLDRDKKLQEIVNRHGKVIFLSGHTHLSMDSYGGNVEQDEEHRNVYINMGSLCPASLPADEPIQPAQWKEGVFLEITVCEREIEIVTRSVKDGRRHARGYYRIRTGKNN